ncbi:hypothetical protein [Salibaculum halophilum]|uniref:hypothetical protein n=1 Tax=Salibaculum halophilum TaxID=1914408 RepID=UPI0015C4C5C7|nr:hypothetical protein [Salibaculum halophilum]
MPPRERSRAWLWVARYLEIFRVYTTYIETDAKWVTPALRFGLARGPIKVEDIR